MMNENNLSVMSLILGLLIIAVIALKFILNKIKIPAIIGFFALGIFLNWLTLKFQIISAIEQDVLQSVANVGLICLLFKVGMDCDLQKIIEKIPQASLVLIGNIVFCAALGFIAAYFILHLSLITSIFIGIAMTTTSDAISLSIWQEKNVIGTSTGTLLVDLAQLDDFSGIILLGLLLSMIPVLQPENNSADILTILEPLAITLLKFAGITMVFYFIFLYSDKPIVNLFHKIDSGVDPILFLLGIGLIIAALVGLLGLSSAIGAFLAGLIFSRVPDKSKVSGSFNPFYNFFVPFFFIGIGLKINPVMLLNGLGVGIILFIAAFLGKFLSTVGLTFHKINPKNSVLLGFSMVPRAEMMLIIMQKGLQANIASPELFSSMILVSIVTCLIIPVTLNNLLNRWQVI